MKILDLSFDSPAENLACDEALLDLCEETRRDGVLRFWAASEYFVVLGYSNKAAEEAHLDLCRKRRIGILRRASGGGTVLQGPGCLNYSLILPIQAAEPLRSINATNNFIMENHRRAIEEVLGKPVSVQGFTDLTLGPLKFSGNSQRRKKTHFLFHGTFLLDFDLSLVDELLAVPARQPSYRQNRPHSGFLTNLGVAPPLIKEALRKTWRAGEALKEAPSGRIGALVESRYGREDWNQKF